MADVRIDSGILTQRAAALLGLAALLLSSAASACMIPVWQNARKHRETATYEAIVYYRGSLGAEQVAAIEVLTGVGGSDSTNVFVTLVDVDGDEAHRWSHDEDESSDGDADADEAATHEEAMDLYRSKGRPGLPWCIVRQPATYALRRIVWSGRLDTKEAEALRTSPVRRTIARRLNAGAPLVWVMLKTGEATADRAAAAVVEARLQDGMFKSAIQPSIVSVRRDDPDEALLVAMLLKSEEGLEEVRAPMAFPVFGYGKVLYCIAGGGITAETVGNAHSFINGPCSCSAKAKNPGMDLMLVSGAARDEDAPAVGEEIPVVLVAENSDGQVGGPGSTVSQTESTTGKVIRNTILTLSAALVVLMVCILVYQRRARVMC